MATVDSLDIQIAASAQVAEKAIDSLIDSVSKLQSAIKLDASGISNVVKSVDLSGVSNQAKNVQAEMRNISDAAKTIVKPMDDAKKSATDLAQELSDKFKNFTPVIDFTQTESSLTKLADKYRQQMTTAQNEINRILASSTADKQAAGIERWTIKLKEAENGVKAIDEHLKNISVEQIDISHLSEDEIKRRLGTPKIHIEKDESINVWLSNLQKDLEELGKLEVIPRGKFEEFEGDLERLKAELPEEIELINQLSDVLQNVQVSADNAGKNIKGISVDELKQRANDLARNLSLLESQIKEFSGKNNQLVIDVDKSRIAVLTELQEKLAMIKNITGEDYKPVFPGMEDEINTVSQRLKALEKQFADVGKGFEFTGNAQQLENEINALNADLEKLYQKRDRQIDLGQINTKPFETTIYDIQRISNQLDILESSRPDALNRTLEENAQKAKELSQTISNFKFNLLSLEIPPIKEENLEKLRSMLNKTEEGLDKLRVKMENGLKMGKITASIDDRTFVNLMEQMSLTEKQAEELRAKIAEIGSQPISDTANFDGVASSMKNVSVSGKQFLSVFDGINRTLRKLGSAAGSAISGIGKLTKSMLLLNTATRKSSGAFNLNFKTILKYAFGIRSTFVLVNKLRNAIKEGMKNLVQYSDETNASISTLTSSLATLKNASAAAASPLLNAIAPALNYLIQLFIKATNAVNQFLSALMGRSTWIKAKDVVSDYAESISDAAGAAKGALQPFDKLNNLTSQQAAGGGGMDASDMFETLPVESKFKDLVDWLKDMWDKADFYDLGKKLGESLKDGLDSIPWNKIKQTARKIGKSLASLINGFIEVEGLGYSIGRTLAEAINTAYEFLNGFVHELHWESIGKFIADTLNGFFENIDWELIRDTLVTGFEGIANAINGFIYGFNWDNVSNTISNVINIIAESVHKFFSTVDWKALGTNLGNQLMETIRKIDWMEVGRALGSIVQSAIDFLKSFVKTLNLSDIANAFMDLLKGFFEEADASDVAWTILTVLGAKLVLAAGSFGFNLAGQAIANSISSAVIPALSTAFSGIGSAISGFASSFLLPALAAVGAAVAGWKIGEWINTNLLDIDTPSFMEMMEGIKSSFTDGSWKEALSLWGNDIYRAFVTLGERQEETFNNIKQDISTKLSEIKTNWIQTWEELKTNVITKFNDIKTSITQNLNLTSLLNSLKSNFTNTFNNIKSSVIGAFNSIKSSVSSALDSIKSKLSSLNSSLSSSKVGSLFKSGFTMFSASPQVPMYSVSVPQFASSGIAESPIQTLSANSQIATASNSITGLSNTFGAYTINTSLPYSVKQSSGSNVAQISSQMNKSGAVNNGSADISSLANAVYSTGQTEAGLLQTAVTLLQMIADKPTLSNGDVFGAVQTEYRQRANRGGYTKDPVLG